MKKLILFIFFFISLYSNDGYIITAVGTFTDSLQWELINKFKEIVESTSNLKIETFCGEHFENEDSVLKRVQEGTIQIGVISSGSFDNFVAEIQILDYPYLFRDYDQVDRYLYKEWGNKILNSLMKYGFKGICFSEQGFRNVTNNKLAIKNVKDVNDLSIRVVQSLIHQEIWDRFGADPIAIAWPFYASLAEGIIDGEENVLQVIYYSKIYTAQHYISLTKHLFSPFICVANLEWYQALSKKDKKIINKAMIESANFIKEKSRKLEKELIPVLKNAGLEIEENPDINSFKEKVEEFYKNPVYQSIQFQELLRPLLRENGVL